jgi:hypothetical protein
MQSINLDRLEYIACGHEEDCPYEHIPTDGNGSGGGGFGSGYGGYGGCGGSAGVGRGGGNGSLSMAGVTLFNAFAQVTPGDYSFTPPPTAFASHFNMEALSCSRLKTNKIKNSSHRIQSR